MESQHRNRITRGAKTHRHDIMQNRGERREPEMNEDDRMEASDDQLRRHERKVKDEHPTGRMTEGGYKSRGGNRR